MPIQNRMAQQDALMEYLTFTSSAIFAVPPGAGPGEYVGQSLFARPSAPWPEHDESQVRIGRGG